MHIQTLRLRTLAFMAGIAIVAFSGWACADPPSRVARLGYTDGAVSFSPAGESDWVQATINRPLTSGDRLWTEERARAEIQVGGAMIRMHADTGMSVLNLDDGIAQLQLTQGILNVRVRRLEPGQVFEVDTPNLAFTLRQPGEYRIEVDPDGDATTIVVRKGQGEVYGEDASYLVDSRQSYRFSGTGLREYQYVNAPRPDEFDRWSSARDRRYDTSSSARYVSQDVVGYQDLDANGTWRVDPTYGNVWIPNNVDAGWAPYRQGHWAWVDPWGWTWVDDAPWGFAVSHYGRWTNLRGTWGWVPGPVSTRAYYAPALVGFVGGDNFKLTLASGIAAGVAWFALGPREVYRPAYPVSRHYFENINHSNSVINSTVINNHYNNTNVTNVVYVNRQVPGAIVAVPTSTFVQSQPVSGAAQRVSRESIAGAPVSFVPTAAPTEKSVRGDAARRDKPPLRVFERPVVARTVPPAVPVGFEAQRQQLTAKPGKPLDDAARKELKPAASAPAPVVNVVAQKQEAPPTMRPPPTVPGAKPGDARGKFDERKAPVAPAISGVPGVPTQGALPAQAAPPLPVTPTPEPRGQFEQRGPREQRGQAAVAPPVPAQGAVQPQAAPPKVAAPAAAAGVPIVPPAPGAQPLPVTPTTEPRGQFEQRGPREQRGQAAVAPPVPAQGVVQPQAAPPKVAAPAAPAGAPIIPPAPGAQPPEQRERSEQRGPREQRAPPAVEPPVVPQGTPQPQAVQPQAASPKVVAPLPPPQRAPESSGVAPQVAPPAPAIQPSQRPVQPAAAQPAQAVPPPPGSQPQRAKSEPAPAAKPVEPNSPGAAPKPVEPRPPAAAPKPVESRPAVAAPKPVEPRPPAAAPKPAEPRPPVAAPKPPPPPPAPKAEPRAEEAKPAAAKP